ncbi:MAG: tripartite tricarboxylate transporter TctB family protein [Chthonomonadetes bacterium]|nr:tripartite tricarboxylate transporter TctB family protein [Chthonomonadetes bacterium]
MVNVRRLCLLITVFAGVLIAGCQWRGEERFPSRSITIICPPAPGGVSDTLTRALAAGAQQEFGVPVVVENKPGGANAVGLNYGAHAAPDGYTVTYVVAELAILPHLGLSPISPDDFDLLARTNYNPAAVTVRADSRWRTLNDLLADARAHPETIRAGNSGTGSIWHLAAVALQEAGGAKFKHVPFGGAAPAVQALLGGHVDVVCVSPTEVQAHVEAGKLRMLAVLTNQRDPLFPDVPCARELGYPLDIGAWGGLALPKGVPAERCQRLLEGFRKAFGRQEFRQMMAERGVRLAWLEGEEFRRFVQAQSALNRELIASMGVNLSRGDVGYLYLPRLLAVLGVLLALAIAVSEKLARRPADTLPMPGVRDSVRMALLSLLFVVLLPLVGFLAASALFLLASVLSTKRVNLWQAIGFTLVVSAGVWWLFQNVLGVPLP